MQDADTVYAITWQSLRNVVVVNLIDEYSGTIENKKMVVGYFQMY